MYVNAFTFGVIFNRRLGYDLVYFDTLARGASRKMAPSSGAESREEHAGIMLV
jgi:hypothetical protein